MVSPKSRACLFTLGALLGACGGTQRSDADSTADGGASSGGLANGGAAGSGGTAGGGTPSGGANGSPSAGGAGQGDASGGTSGGSSLPPASSIDCRKDGDDKTTLTFVNGCSTSITFEGSDIEGGTLAPGAFACVDIGSATEAINSKRYWGFRGEDPGAEHHTLAEFTFNTDFYDFDWYNISHVDAHNLPLQIVPLERDQCEVLTCERDLLAACPSVGQLKDSSGAIVACVSPARDDPESPVALYFEQCDDAYAWSGDDQRGDDPSPMRSCAGEDWDIVFCPEAE